MTGANAALISTATANAHTNTVAASILVTGTSTSRSTSAAADYWYGGYRWCGLCVSEIGTVCPHDAVNAGRKRDWNEIVDNNTSGACIT